MTLCETLKNKLSTPVAIGIVIVIVLLTGSGLYWWAGRQEFETKLQLPINFELSQRTPTECPDLEDRLYRVFQASEPLDLAGKMHLDVKDDKVRVVIVLVQKEIGFLKDFGVEVEIQHDGQVQAFVPINQLCKLADTDEVVEIRVPARGLPLQ